MPDKSGMDAALSLPSLAGPSIGATACPKAGVAAAAASVTTKRKSRRCNFMPSSLFIRFCRIYWVSPEALALNLHPLRERLKGA
jgi:hypothetical protein